MEDFKSYYAIIPANVRYDKDLPANAKLLYGEITALCNEKGICWATNDYFAKLYDVSKTSISKWISTLVDKGYICNKIIYREGSKEILNRYLSLVQYPIEEKLNRGIEEKLKENNTVYNNTMNNIDNMNIIYNWESNQFCQCLTQKGDICSRRSTYNINGKNYCNQHSKHIISDYLNEHKDIQEEIDLELASKEIIDHLNARLGSSYKYSTKKTKDLIKDRFKEGFTVEDFKTVIDKMCVKWTGTKWEEYLRPQTLFGGNFESYLNKEVKQTINNIHLTSEDISNLFN